MINHFNLYSNTNIGFTFPSLETTLLVGGTLVVLFLAYRAALPRPIPGIPCNASAASSLLGDIPEMLSYARKHRVMFVSAAF
jgi:hypothetical protein